MTLHTGPGCTIANGDTQGASAGTAYSGSLTSTNCVSGAGDNQGCQIVDNSQGSYGSSFNANGGGVYAMDWTSTGISMYFFPRGSVPQDATGDSPNPASWGTPVAHFSGGCDISSAFTNQQIVFDTTFCGDWAGKVWDGSTCASQHGGTCENFVANNPSAFKDAYWSINALKVYQSNGGSSPSNAPSPLSVPHSSAPASAGQPSATAWAAPSAAPPSSAPASQGQSSVSAWGASSATPSGPAQSSFVTVPSGGKSSPMPTKPHQYLLTDLSQLRHHLQVAAGLLLSRAAAQLSRHASLARLPPLLPRVPRQQPRARRQQPHLPAARPSLRREVGLRVAIPGRASLGSLVAGRNMRLDMEHMQWACLSTKGGGIVTCDSTRHTRPEDFEFLCIRWGYDSCGILWTDGGVTTRLPISFQ